jgi:hypothetical protein
MENPEEKMSIASFGGLFQFSLESLLFAFGFIKKSFIPKKKDVEKPKEKVSRPITLSLSSSLKKVFECWILRFSNVEFFHSHRARRTLRKRCPDSETASIHNYYAYSTNFPLR